ncbi:Phox homology [Dillenia turbinata]|uniref:Phox homology n=1 Tax=Dillenia turbinata TaxID=194707 RepID=A0AAN8Z1B2_9MAGN
MKNGEETNEKPLEVASPYQFDQFLPWERQELDGGDSSPVLSHYSSCGESEFDRYCSANSALGTPSVCSSVGTIFRDSLDFELGHQKSFRLDDGGLFGLEGASDGRNGGKSEVEQTSHVGLGGALVSFKKGLKLYDSEESSLLGHGRSLFGFEDSNDDGCLIGLEGSNAHESGEVKGGLARIKKGVKLYDYEESPLSQEAALGLTSCVVESNTRAGSELGPFTDLNKDAIVRLRRKSECSSDLGPAESVLGQRSNNTENNAVNLLVSGDKTESSHVVEARVACLFGGLDSGSTLGFEDREQERVCEEDETSSKNEYSEDEGSMFGCGTDDEHERDSYSTKHAHFLQQDRPKNGIPLLIGSSVAFGTDDWDDFEQERGESTSASEMFKKCEKHEEENLESMTEFQSFGDAAPVDSKELGGVEGEDMRDAPPVGSQVQQTDKSASNNQSHCVKNIRQVGEDQFTKENLLRKVSKFTDISKDQIHNYTNSEEIIGPDNNSVLETEDLGKSEVEPSRTGANFIYNCIEQDHRYISSKELNEFDGGQTLEGGKLGKTGLDPPGIVSTVKDGCAALEHQFVSADGIMYSTGDQVLDNQDSEKPELQFDPLSDSNNGQLGYPSSEAFENNRRDIVNCQQLTSVSLMDKHENGAASDNIRAVGDLYENCPAPTKMKNLEANDAYDEVVLDMEEILLDSGESPRMFSHSKELGQSQLPSPLRDGGSTASTSGPDFTYPLTQPSRRIDGVEVVGAKQKKGDVSLSERLVGVKEYTVYRIRVWSGQEQWEIERRYRDFFTLYRRLKKLYTDQGWVLPPPWSLVEWESRKIFGNASPDVVAERSVLIQDCLRSIIHCRFSSSIPKTLDWFLSPQNAVPSSLVPSAPMPHLSYLTGEGDCENVCTLGVTISLIVETRPHKTTKQMLEAQHYTCAGCHRHFDEGKTLMHDFVQTFGWGKPRLCEYTGQLFCSSCHTNDTAVLPARVLHHWDFMQYPVSQLAKSYLDSIHDQPMLCVSAVNPLLFSKVPALLHVMGLRKKMGAVLPYVRCPFRRAIFRALGSRRYLLEVNDFFALRDLIDLSKGAFAALPVLVETVSRKIIEHVTEQCLVCCDVGVPCGARQACDDPSSLIFPFQESEVERCKSCESVFHKHCFNRLASCSCGVDLYVGNVTAPLKQLSSESQSTVDLLGRKVESPGGLLSTLFSKMRKENVWGSKGNDNVILMGSLPPSAPV